MAQAYPTAVGGFTKGLKTGFEFSLLKRKMAQEETAIEEKKKEKADLKTHREWERHQKGFDQATKWAMKLPVGQRGQFVSDYLSKAVEGSQEFQDIANLYKNADDENFNALNKVMTSLNKKVGTGESPILELGQLKSLGGSEAVIDAYKEQFGIDKKEIAAKRYNEIYSLHESVISEASAGGKAITPDEANQMAVLEKRYPEMFKEARMAWAKDKDKTKPEMTPTTAKGKIAQAIKAREAFKTGKGLSPLVVEMLRKDNPDLLEMMQGSADVTAVTQAFDDYIASLEQFVGGTTLTYNPETGEFD